MANTKCNKIRDLSTEELDATLLELRQQIFHMRNAKQMNKKAEKPHLLRAAKREIARVLTVQREKQTAKA